MRNEFEFCAHEHATVRECRLVDQSSVVLLTSSGYFTLGEIKGYSRLVKVYLFRSRGHGKITFSGMAEYRTEERW